MIPQIATSSTSPIGRISHIQRGSTAHEDERYFTYDEFGRPAGTVTYIKGERFEEAFAYSAEGYLDSRAYPSSGIDPTTGQAHHFTVAYRYQNGYLTEISGLDEHGNKCITHWKANLYDALGRTHTDTLGELVTTTREYDPAQGVLNRIQSTLQVGDHQVSFAGDTVQDLTYQYDGNHNLTSRNDALTNVSETFTYDDLDRLRFASRTAQGSTETTEVRYDPLGNITYKSDVGDYEYTSSRPHAVTQVTAIAYQNQQTTDPLAKFQVDWEWNGETLTNSQPNIHDSTYQYDANGNITQQGDRLFAWTAFDKPSAMLRQQQNGTYTGATLEYNADFTRNYKQEGTFSALGAMTEVKETTYYINKDYEKIVNSQGTRHRYTIHTGGGSIQIEREDGSPKDQPKYLLTDHLGSINVILNGLAQVEQRLEFDPWGMRTNTPQTGTVNHITTKGYTGHEMDDEVGLINMNARVYDPYLGRFMSADPILPNPYDLQQFNRYSYVSNNPLKYTDPTGNSQQCGPSDGFVNGEYVQTNTCDGVSWDNDPYTQCAQDWLCRGWDVVDDIGPSADRSDLGALEEWEADPDGSRFEEDNFSDPNHRSNRTADELAEERETNSKYDPYYPMEPGLEPVPFPGVESTIRDIADAFENAESARELGVLIFGNVIGKKFKKIREIFSKPKKETKARVNKVEPNPNAEGSHTQFKRDPKTGEVTGYTEFDADGNPVKRFRAKGKPHGGKEPPFILEPKPGKGPGSPPKVPRTPRPDELPGG